MLIKNVIRVNLLWTGVSRSYLQVQRLWYVTWGFCFLRGPPASMGQHSWVILASLTQFCDLLSCLSTSAFQQPSRSFIVLLLTSLCVCSSSQDWKAQLKLPPVDARYKTEVRIKFVEPIDEILLEECGHLKWLCLHMMMGKRYLVTCTPLVYKSVW